jgi:DNA-binding response OmpR family regulator
MVETVALAALLTIALRSVTRSMRPILFVCPPGFERDFYVSQLVEAGFDTVVADDPNDADEQLARAAAPEIAILDLVRNAELSWALAARLATTTSVIALTAMIRPDGGNRRRAWECGCAAFVAKPCSPRQLVEIVRRVHHGERGIEITTYSP